MGNKAAWLHRWLALLLTTALLLLLGGSAARRPEAQAAEDEEWVQRWETRWCHACGRESLFWVMYLPLDGERHQVQTMCLAPDCGAINGDLPVEDEGHWNNVFRPEPHALSAQVVPPTCTQGGYTVYTCEGCGYRRQGDETPAAGHRFGPWVTQTEPTAEREGVQQRTCEVCGATETTPLPRPTPDRKSVV